mmetsp:Transcript_51575/g.66057  ORF Transcript_51575/g.66057 Transcript_51575/m.66057 type:complete len:234 (+) Transcript_51575:34-735(+)
MAHIGYNKNENVSLHAEKGDQIKTLVGNWHEERALLEIAGHSRNPPEKRGFPGPERTILHRDEEKPVNYASSLRSAFVNPESHANFFPTEGGKGLGRREMLCLAEFKAQAEVEANQREVATTQKLKQGSYDLSSLEAMRKIDDSVYAEQKASGKFKRSNKFSNDLSKPRSNVSCPDALEGKSYLDAPAISSWSYKGNGEISAQFKYKENGLDHEPSQVWGHGTQGAMPQVRGT